MARGKKIKTLVLMGGITEAAGVAPAPTVYEAHTWQDDVELIGYILSTHWSPSSHAAVQAGHYDSLAHLTRSSQRFSPGEIAHVSALTRVLDAGVLGIAPVGDTTKTVQDMFPDGLGVHFDDGDVITLMGNGDSDAATAGTVTYSAWALLYYIER